MARRGKWNLWWRAAFPILPLLTGRRPGGRSSHGHPPPETLRPHSESVHIPLVSSANAADVARSILGAAVAGNITPDAAAQLLSAAAGLSRIIETEELKARLEALERCIAPPKPGQKKRL